MLFKNNHHIELHESPFEYEENVGATGDLLHLEEPNDIVSPTQDLSKAIVWTISSAITLYTTKRLMSHHGFHYPLTIAACWFAVLFTLSSLGISISKHSSHVNDRNLKSWVSNRIPQPDIALPDRSWIRVLPAAIVAAVSLPMLLEGLLHMPAISVLAMIFPLAYVSEAVILYIFCSAVRSRQPFPWEIFVSAGASASVLYNDYRLEVPGLIWGVTGILLVGVSRALLIIGSESITSTLEARLNSYHGFKTMAILLGFLFSMVSAFIFESVRFDYGISSSTFVLMFINIAAVVGAMSTGASLILYSPISSSEDCPRFSTVPVSVLDGCAAFFSSLLILLAAIHSNAAPVISWVQLASSFASTISLFGFEQIHTIFLDNISAISLSFAVADSSSFASRIWTRWITLLVLFFAIIFSSGFISALSSNSINSIAPVSMYDESPETVKTMLDHIKQTTMLSSLTPNIIIYTKESNANTSMVKEATGADSVERLENLGREGATYLHHIVHNWDTLAEQTMFLQAHAHNMRELIPRIDSYLVPDTGMLSLGFSGTTCSCNECEDRWNWSDSFALIPSLYSRIYGKECEKDTQVLLSYKGQFVASGRRIRGVSRTVWTDMLKGMTSTEGWSHDKKIVKEKTDTPDNPFLGFTVERVWGLLMQCATDGSVAAKCPSLLSGMSRNGDVEDCQCLDAEKIRH